MKDARITLVTLGVADLDRAARFYEALGWRRTAAGNESVVFLQGEGIALSLFGAASLAEDAGLPLAEPLPRFRGITLAINLGNEAETDRLYAAALRAGGTDVKPPEKVFWGGYSGYFADPDGHLWEVAHNPFFAMDERGHLDLTASEAEPSTEGATFPASVISASKGEIEASTDGDSSAPERSADRGAASQTTSHTTERQA